MKTAYQKHIVAVGMSMALLMAPMVALGQTQENEFIKNNGFEEGASGCSIENGAKLSDTVFRTGKASVWLNPSGNTGGMVRISTGPLEQGQYYRADAWGKVSNAKDDRTMSPILVVDQKGLYSSAGNHDWELVSFLYKAVANGPILFAAACPKDMTGEVYVDDMSFRKCADPHLSPIDFEDGSTLGMDFYNDPRPIYSVVEGATPAGKKYLTLDSKTSACYVQEEPITSGAVEFDFLIKAKSNPQVSFIGSGISIRLIPSLLIEQKTGNGNITAGTINPDAWYRIQGIIRLEQRTMDIKVTDFDDALGSFEKKGIPISQEKITLSNIYFGGNGIGLDNIYIGKARKDK